MLTSVDDLPAEVPVESASPSRQGEFFEDADGIDFDDDQDFDPR
jgi:hypothetical protein